MKQKSREFDKKEAMKEHDLRLDKKRADRKTIKVENRKMMNDFFSSNGTFTVQR